MSFLPYGSATPWRAKNPCRALSEGRSATVEAGAFDEMTVGGEDGIEKVGLNTVIRLVIHRYPVEIAL
jgi:hypothetical protein